MKSVLVMSCFSDLITSEDALFLKLFKPTSTTSSIKSKPAEKMHACKRKIELMDDLQEPPSKDIKLDSKTTTTTSNTSTIKEENSNKNSFKMASEKIDNKTTTTNKKEVIVSMESGKVATKNKTRELKVVRPPWK